MVLYFVSMESTGHAEGALSALPWVSVNVGGSKLLAKAWFGDTEYQLLLSDLNSVWEEEMTTDSIERRAQARFFHTPTTRVSWTVDSWHKLHYIPNKIVCLLCPSQVLNKRLRAPVHAFFAHLRSVASPCLSNQSYEKSTSVHFVLKHHGGNLTVELKSELGDVPFYWEFRCTPTSIAVV